MTTYVALLRGINVGKAKAVSMSKLASVFAALGFSDVRTVLRSGNVVFQASLAAAGAIEAAVLAATGVHASVLILSGEQFLEIARENPLRAASTDGSKLFVTFVSSMPKQLELPDASALAPEQLAVTDRAIYQWMPDGSQATRVPTTFWKQFNAAGAVITARNDNTVQKIAALLE